MKRENRFWPILAGLAGLLIAGLASGSATAQQKTAVSDQPGTSFKLATFETGGKIRLGLSVQEKLLDLAEANAYVTKQAGLAPMPLPGEMRELIEQYGVVSKRLYQIANYLGAQNRLNGAGLAFVYDPAKVSFKAPIKYPYNLMAAAANYKSHAQEMAAPRPAAGAPPAGGPPAGFGFQAVDVNPDTEDPHFFAKSPRSCIIDPGEPFYIHEGSNIDWEIELAIVMGQPALDVSLEKAHDHVFGYSIIYDVSRRGGTGRSLNKMFPGVNWYRGKSIDRGAPFGPYIVPKEFIDATNLRLTTKVNGVVKQDGSSKDMIYDEAHMIRFLTSAMTLYPGDVIATGTPDGVGMGRRPPEFLKPGDVVEMEIEGIGKLITPMKAAPVTP